MIAILDRENIMETNISVFKQLKRSSMLFMLLFVVLAILAPTVTPAMGQQVAEIQWGETIFTYDGEDHIPTAIVTNLEVGDECEVTVDGAESDAGTYTARITGLSNPNYTLPDIVTTPFTIQKLTAEIEWGETSFTYDGEEHAPTATVTGLIDGDECEAIIDGAQSAAGEHTATTT